MQTPDFFTLLWQAFTPSDIILIIMQVFSAGLRLAIMLPLLFWLISKIDSVGDTDLTNWWEKADARSQSIYLSVRLVVVAFVLVGTLA
ncbi:hypothetical protein [Aeromonas sp. R7-1]|uniref:hypothetical protein n=1 Tax=Aeromonas sp. R7-1 TaxID=3138473 RepID=UPI0034A30AEC